MIRHPKRALQTHHRRRASVTSTKRGAYIAAHSIYLHTKEHSDEATQDLHEALLSTVVAQLAAPDTGRYQGTVKNIILTATSQRSGYATTWLHTSYDWRLAHRSLTCQNRPGNSRSASFVSTRQYRLTVTGPRQRVYTT